MTNLRLSRWPIVRDAHHICLIFLNREDKGIYKAWKPNILLKWTSLRLPNPTVHRTRLAVGLVGSDLFKPPVLPYFEKKITVIQYTLWRFFFNLFLSYSVLWKYNCLLSTQFSRFRIKVVVITCVQHASASNRMKSFRRTFKVIHRHLI